MSRKEQLAVTKPPRIKHLLRARNHAKQCMCLSISMPPRFHIDEESELREVKRPAQGLTAKLC